MKANKVWNKLLIGALLVGTLITPTTADALSQSTIERFKSVPITQQQIQEAGSPISVYMQDSNGALSKMNLNYPVMILNNRAAVAVKDITDNLDATLAWDGSNRIATINKDGDEIAFPIGRRTMAINDQIKSIDTNATIYSRENRTYLPFASLADALGMQAAWIPAGTGGAVQNSIILAPKGVTVNVIPASIQPTPPPITAPQPKPQPPTTTTPVQNSKYATPEQIEFLYGSMEREFKRHNDKDSNGNIVTRENFKRWSARMDPRVREISAEHFYRDVAPTLGLNTLATHPDFVYSNGANYVAAVETKVEGSSAYQRVIIICMNYKNNKMFAEEFIGGTYYIAHPWQKIN